MRTAVWFGLPLEHLLVTDTVEDTGIEHTLPSVLFSVRILSFQNPAEDCIDGTSAWPYRDIEQFGQGLLKDVL